MIFWKLAPILVMMWHFPVIESAAPIEFRGEVGGNVTIQCAIERRPILFFYFQKGTDFVNGYHASKKIGSNKWANTWMSQDKAVHIYSLNVSHGGDYDCLVKYNDSHEIKKNFIHLSITANFSKPAVTLHPIDDIHWLVTCSSHGGYPSSEMMWNVPESPMVKAVNSSETTDPVTLTFNRSSTVFFNCSGGETKNLSCSVGGVTSDIFSVCTPKDPPGPSPFTPSVIAAICVAVVIAIIFITVLCLRGRKCKKRQRGAATSPGVQLEKADGENEQDALNGDREAA
uniref:CD276 antigen-like n=1 Tax=Semicossyphus pulcher TaxID=241346 RepID=UPI0037E6F88C